MLKVLRHTAAVLALLALFLGLPALRYVDVPGLILGTADAVSGATVEPPESPSGEYLVLMNRSVREESLPEWEDFFSERPVGVIMEDVSCMTAAADAQGFQLAERYRLRLAENQMKVRQLDGLLLVSRAEHGLFDVIILSREIADYYDYSRVMERSDVKTITVRGGV